VREIQAYAPDDMTADAVFKYGHLRTWDTRLVTSFQYALSGCYFQDQEPGGNDDITGWNTSAADNMTGMFHGAINFNQALRFDTRHVQNMNEMFWRCAAFNQPVTFDTRAVITMARMFSECTSFNQPLDFDTHAVTSMSMMFRGCTSLNQPLDFDTHAVRDMTGMFSGCTTFNQPLPFDTHAVTSFNQMFEGCTAFNQPLDQWYHEPSPFRDPVHNMFHGCERFLNPVFRMSVVEYRASELSDTPLGQTAVMQEVIQLLSGQRTRALGVDVNPQNYFGRYTDSIRKNEGRIIVNASLEACEPPVTEGMRTRADRRLDFAYRPDIADHNAYVVPRLMSHRKRGREGNDDDDDDDDDDDERKDGGE
jgi:hypothetical protein